MLIKKGEQIWVPSWQSLPQAAAMWPSCHSWDILGRLPKELKQSPIQLLYSATLTCFRWYAVISVKSDGISLGPMTWAGIGLYPPTLHTSNIYRIIVMKIRNIRKQGLFLVLNNDGTCWDPQTWQRRSLHGSLDLLSGRNSPLYSIRPALPSGKFSPNHYLLWPHLKWLMGVPVFHSPLIAHGSLGIQLLF